VKIHKITVVETQAIRAKLLKQLSRKPQVKAFGSCYFLLKITAVAWLRGCWSLIFMVKIT
jgi:hypothetical protein